MQRQLFICSILVGLTLALLTLDSSGQEKKKKKGPKPGPAPTFKADGENVDGALWHFTAKNIKTDEVKEFRIRVLNYKFYTLAGKEAGSSEPTELAENKKAKLTFTDPLPLVGEAEITRVGPGRAGGELKTKDGQVWNLRIKGTDK